MKTRIPLTIILSLFINFLIIAQTGPGGVGSNDGTSNLLLWLRGDDINADGDTTNNPVTGSNIYSWLDSSGKNNHYTIINTAPVFIDTFFEGVDFTQSSFLRLGPAVSQTFNQGNVFFAMRGRNGTTFSNVLFDDGVRSYRFEQYFESGFLGYSRYTVADYLSTLNSPFNIDAIVSFEKTAFSNNVTINSNNSSSTFNNGGNDLIMARFGGTNTPIDQTNYDMYEVLAFNTKLNDAQEIIVNNYLSAKYGGIPITFDLYDEDNIANGNFDHKVAGIGQAFNGSNHRDSQGTGIVRINSPSALSNGDYLFWGEETKNPIYNFNTNLINYTEQLNSRWRVSKINNLGTVSVSFDITNIDLSGKLNCSPLQLVVDNDSDFSSPSSYNLTIIGNTAIATGISFADGDYFTLRYVDQIVWNGTTFFNGSGTGNAPDTSNECLKLTIMSGNTASLTFDAHVREVQIDNGAILNVSDGELLEVENHLEINGTLELLGEAQLTQNHTGVTSNSGTGALTARQQGSTNLFNYNYWSSPVNVSGIWQIGYLRDANGVINFHSSLDADPNTLPITLSNYWLYSFNATSEDYNGWNNISTTTNINPGIGYTMKGSGSAGSDQEYIFRGIPNDGNYSYAVTANNNFLIGNPYPSALDADQFINDNSSVIDGTLYFWEHFNSNSSHYLADYEGGYATYNLTMGVAAVADNSGLTSGDGTASKAAPTQFINVGQGFFVTIQNNGNLVFNNQQRAFARESLNETTYYRNSRLSAQNSTSTDPRTKIWFTLKEPGEHLKTIGLGYDSNASYGYDNGYDGIAYDDLRNDFYWLLEGNKLVIQGLPVFDVNDEIVLGVKVTDSGTYTFGISNIQNFPDDTPVYLKDNLLDTYHDLKLGDHQIVLDTNTDEERFSIVFKEAEVLSLDNKTIFNDIHVFYNKNSNKIVIKNPRNLNFRQLSLYNIMGQSILDMKDAIDLNINTQPLQDGIYILKIKTDNGTLEKRIVKY